MRLIVTDTVAQSVGLSVTDRQPTKAAEPIVMLFWMLTVVVPRNHVLDEVQLPTREERAILRTCLTRQSGDGYTQSHLAGAKPVRPCVAALYQMTLSTCCCYYKRLQVLGMTRCSAARAEDFQNPTLHL